MNKHAIDLICWLLGGIVLCVIVSTIGVAYLDYLSQHEEYAEQIGINTAFHTEYCLDSNKLARYPQLIVECHKSKHAAYDDPRRRAMRDILMRWSICDSNGCDTILDRFGGYFTIFTMIAALIFGGWGAFFAYKTFARRENDILPRALLPKKQS